MKSYSSYPLPIAADALAIMREALLGSPLVGGSTLGGSFRQSRGFAITFTAAGRPELQRRFPALEPFLNAAIDLRALGRLQPWYRRTLAPNAWYLNLLLISEGGSVGRHVDGTLRGPSGQADLVPLAVSVLYLQVPPGEGGALALLRGRKALATVAPREGLLVHFEGSLDHEVTALTGAPDGAQRVSLVLEQYRVAEATLPRLPPFKLDSRAGFQAYLQAHAAAGPEPARFDLEK